MAFQHRGFLVIRTVTEAAVGAALGDSAVVLAVYIFMGNGLRQIQIKFGGAVMQNVDVLVPCVGGAVGLVTVPVSTAAAYRFGPVVAGVIGVLAGDTGIQTTYRYFVNTHPVGILDVAVQGRLTGAGILRNTPDGEICIFPAGGAVEGLMGDDGIDIQLIRPVAGLLPMLNGIMVAVLLSRKGGGDHAKTQCQRQKHGRYTVGKEIFFIQMRTSSLYFPNRFLWIFLVDYLITAPSQVFFFFADTHSSPCRCGVPPRSRCSPWLCICSEIAEPPPVPAHLRPGTIRSV